MNEPDPATAMTPAKKTPRWIPALILGLGFLLLLGSCAPFGTAIMRGLSAHQATRLALTLDTEYLSEPIALQTDQFIQLAARLDIATPAITLGTADDGNDEFKAQYNFPLHYSIETPEGHIIASQKTRIAWNHSGGGQSVTDKQLSSQGGTLTLEQDFDKIKLQTQAPIRVRIKIGSDTQYQAQAQNIEAIVYDDVYRHGPMITAGVAMLIAGFLFLLVGIVALIALLANQTQRRAPSNGQTLSIDAQERNGRDWAMWCHLGAYAGFIVPFGGLIAPVLLWIMGRERYAFADRHGSEAVNFRISITLYYILALALSIILVGLLLLPVIMLFDLIMPIIGAVKAHSGEEFRYPLTLRFIRNETP